MVEVLILIVLCNLLLPLLIGPFAVQVSRGSARLSWELLHKFVEPVIVVVCFYYVTTLHRPAYH